MDNLQVALTKQQIYLQKIARKKFGSHVTLDLRLKVNPPCASAYEIAIWDKLNILHMESSIKSRNKAIAWLKGL